MKKPVTKTHPPQLAYGKNRHGNECWKLYQEEGELTVCLEIRYYYGDEDMNHYTVYAADADSCHTHGYREVMTVDEFTNTIDTIEQMEGEEEAALWIDTVFDRHYMLASRASGNTAILRIAEELKARWEAMLALTLFAPTITL